MNQSIPHETILRIGTALFEAVDVPTLDARLTVGELVTSSLMGHDSHGVLRIPEYLEHVEEGSVVKGAEISVEHSSETTAVVDCGHNFGTVGAHAAMREAIIMASEHKTACVVTRRCLHAGRLGAYVQAAAEEGLIAIATCNSPIYGHFVLPFGGREGRLATNPIAYGVPTGGDPILADLSTSVAPEGKVRVHLNEGKPLPEGWVVDADGNPTADPKQFYGPPRGGILPLGGVAAHKGFALGLLVEILGSALAGISSTDEETVGNGICFIVVDPTSFCPIDRFRALMDDLVTYVKSSPPAPGFDEVIVPGELEYRSLRERTKTGIPIDPPTLQAIKKRASQLGVNADGI